MNIEKSVADRIAVDFLDSLKAEPRSLGIRIRTVESHSGGLHTEETAELIKVRARMGAFLPCWIEVKISSLGVDRGSRPEFLKDGPADIFCRQ